MRFIAMRRFILSLNQDARTVVIGLGYVGLPLAVALAKSIDTVGFDIDSQRIAELKAGHDRTGEIDGKQLRASSISLTDDPAKCPPSDFYIVTVPTPVNADKKPDLSALENATRTVGAMLSAAHADGRVPVVIYESTVYPGVTEDFCGPILEEFSRLTCKKDFFLAYSPERINPGDRKHTVDTITKVVSGQTPQVLDQVAELYNRVTIGGTYRAASIQVAEGAKVIENAQRDINIAFMNEITQIFERMNLSVWDVLEAASTKWNFLPFKPGLVGGHCIGVDPYYLSHRAEELGYDPKVILAGRSTNDGMAEWVAERLHSFRDGKAGRVLMLGLTFKENVPDLRNSKVLDLVRALAARGHEITGHDPHADPGEVADQYGLKADQGALQAKYDLVVLAVPHREYLDRGIDFFRARLASQGTLADLKGVLGDKADWSF
ncbi:MAG: nucleotide sugar dehydrogenase [Sphingomonadaceae bacterium]